MTGSLGFGIGACAANVMHQPRRALRAVGCMRLFGTRWKLREGSGVLSLDHLVRLRQHRRRNRQAESLGGLEIDHQLELRGLLNREICGLGSL